jgi:hypothetical protein
MIDIQPRFSYIQLTLKRALIKFSLVTIPSRKKNLMEWYVYLAHFLAGVFLANGVPHFVNGISGRKFQTPFASLPSVGESSPIVNVLWGIAHFAIGYLLLTGISHFTYGPSIDS